MGFDSRTLIPGCSSGFKHIASQSAFVIVSSLCVSTYLTHLSNSFRILWSWTWKRNKGRLLLKSVLKVGIVVFFSVMSLKHISKKHIFGFGALLKFFASLETIFIMIVFKRHEHIVYIHICIYFFLFFFFDFWVALHCLWDLSSLHSDWTCALCSWSVML